MILIRGEMHKTESGSRENALVVSPIGILHTPFEHAQGTPIQGASSKGARGVVEVFPEFVPGLGFLAPLQWVRLT
jgi:tRNA (Thr-GGU) A37 N-methylase